MALMLAFGAFMLVACGEEEEGTETGDEGTPKPGGVYNYPLSANPPSIDAATAYESEGMQVVHQIYEGLVALEADESGTMVPVPKIAESWSANEDATVWTFKLKQGVMFQPPVSREVVAQDFVDSWNYVSNPDVESWTSYILSAIEGCADSGYWETDAGLTGVKAIDDYTLEVTLRYPYADFAMTLAHPIASAQPVEYIEEVGAKAYNRKPVGTGPFMVDEWKNNKYVHLLRNPDYWDTENAAYLDEVNMPIILETSTSWLEFQKGTVDFTDVPPGQIKVAESRPEVASGEWTAKAWPELSTYAIYVNMNNPAVGGPENLELRKALALSADAKTVIDIVKEGAALPATGISPDGMTGYQADLSPYAYDPEAAKEIVAGLGDVPTIQYWYNTDEGHQKVAEVLQAGWADVGIDVELSNFEWGTFNDMLADSGDGGPDSAQIFRMGWLADYPSLDNFLYPLFHSSQQGAYNNSFYDNPEFDELLAQARQTTDEAQRINLYLQAEKLMLTDVPCIPIYYYRSFRVTNNRIANFTRDPMGFTDMWTLWVK
jgi:peptide/nickel transport system substrate-binding protein/oligopeptide transport system substrate-binding protein